ncbi:hypothetical protein BDM02DRAFT_3109335 [Thelephora ganbajun]|uniref:Uncharacterized protein n=1 Tax=Thelephora ganbajun TaxID=370292 RepID=A0ACB6ZSB9_THEGA|nr:hypothetical protein BDM02DRAFT_3109335 [Thelephora ganbajun]
MSSGSQVQHLVVVSVIGVGLVGSELVDQLSKLPSPGLRDQFQLLSLSSSRSTVYYDIGNDWQSNWRKDIAASDIKPDAQALATRLTQISTVEEVAGLRQGVSFSVIPVLVDNTSSEAVARLYPFFLSRGINVVTPNKKAFSSELTLYEEIVAASLKTGTRFYNESTVGAGLPIISTIKDLIATGDKVTKIEGVFSGTLSYIFNEFSDGKSRDGPSFSSIVSVARQKGYTEPNPADDLNGADVARKLTILSRYIPSLRDKLPDGYKSVSTKSLVPAALDGVRSGDEFVEKLSGYDQEFDKLRSDAFEEDKVLRFVGVIDVASGVIKADLERYTNTHPFVTSLGGSDNIVMFHTERYGARPLIVQGAGAGAAVTAMGVLGDLLRFL